MGEVKTKIIDRKVSLIGIDSVIGKSMVVSKVMQVLNIRSKSVYSINDIN